MKAVKIVMGIVTVLIVAPIWLYLLYQILVRVQATELMFFLFWIYVPVMLLTNILSQIIINQKEGK